MFARMHFVRSSEDSLTTFFPVHPYIIFLLFLLDKEIIFPMLFGAVAPIY